MTIFDPIRAAIDAAEAADNAEFDTWQATLNQIKAQAAADAAAAAAKATAYEATIADLKAQIIKLTPKPVPDPVPVPVPVPVPAGGTIFGMNLGSRSVAQRLSQFGRVPMVKQFSLVDVAALPEKRAQVCLPYTPGDLSAGKYDAVLTAHIKAQVAAGVKRIVYTYRQEPEDILRTGQAAVDQWKADTKHLAALIKANGKAGVTLAAPCLIAPHKSNGMIVPDAWMMTPDELGGLDWAMWTWDDYLNPSGAKNYGGDPYATPYPDGAALAAEMFAPTIKFGWKNWGISEFNSPWRKTLNPADADHSQRIAHLDAYVKACLAAPAEIGPPMHMLLWEEIGNQFDQTFTTPSEYAWWKGWVGKSA